MSKNNIPDSPTVLQNGTGTPYVGIFNGMAQPIIDPKHNLPIGIYVTSFEYVYDEEDIDEARIVIDCDNPDLVDHHDLQYYRPIQLQWGYVFPSNVTYQGPVRKLMITGREITFNESGTHITLILQDATVILKNSPANYYNNTSGFLNYTQALFKGLPIGCSMYDYVEATIKKQVVAKQVIPSEEISSNRTYYESKYGTHDSNKVPLMLQSMWDEPDYITGEVHKATFNVFRGHYEEGLPSKVYQDVVGMTLLEASEGNVKLAEKFPEWMRLAQIEIGGAHNLVVMGVNPSVYGQIEEVFRWAKNGPYFLDGRDNMLTIHNQLKDRPISKVYTYAGGNGELLDFKVSSEYTLTVVGVTKTSELTPDGTLKQTEAQVVNADDTPGKLDRENIIFGTWGEGNVHNPKEEGQTNFESDLKFDEKGRVTNPQDKDSNFTLPPTYVSPKNYIEVPENYYELQEQARENEKLAKRIEANSPNAVYESIEAAKGSMGFTNLHITKEEAEQFWKDLKKQYEESLNPNSKPANDESWGQYLHDFHNLGTLYLHRKAKIRAIVDSKFYADPENQALINEVLSGKRDIAGNIHVRNNQPHLDPFQNNTKLGIQFLKSVEGIKVIEGEPVSNYINRAISNSIDKAQEEPGIHYYNGLTDVNAYKSLVIVEYEAEFEVPIDGTRVVANTPVEWASCVFPQRLEEHTQDQMEASAVVIGDPCLESSMNIYIRNVSQRYSGVWYTKKVTHRFSTGDGYKCDIEFKQRTDDTITNTAECTVDLRGMVTDLQKRAQNLIKAGSSIGGTDYKGENPDPFAPETNISNQFKYEVKEKYPINGTSILIKLDKDFDMSKGLEGGGEYEKYQADEAIPYSMAFNQEGNLSLRDPDEVLKDDCNTSSDGYKNIQKQ